jgi:hypothetical protein
LLLPPLHAAHQCKEPLASDIVAVKNAPGSVTASLVAAETFPVEQFGLHVRDGEDCDALSTSMRYDMLWRLHAVVPGRSYQSLCARIVSEFGDKALAKEAAERN